MMMIMVLERDRDRPTCRFISYHKRHLILFLNGYLETTLRMAEECA